MYISYVSPEQTKQEQHLETIEAARDKGQWIEKVTKMNESKQWNEVIRRSLPSPQFIQQAASIGTSPLPLKYVVCFKNIYDWYCENIKLALFWEKNCIDLSTILDSIISLLNWKKTFIKQILAGDDSLPLLRKIKISIVTCNNSQHQGNK